jgi:uncharacterized protein YggE
MLKHSLLSFFIILTFQGIAQEQAKKISIGGSATIYHKPDLCVILFEIQTTGPTKQEVRKQISEKRESLVKLLKSFPFIEMEKINAESEWVRLMYENHETKKLIANGGQRIRIPVSANEQNLNQLIESIQDKNLEIEYHLSYSFSPQLRDSLEKEALKLAISNAKNSATLIEKESNIQLTEIKEIDFNYKLIANGYMSTYSTDYASSGDSEKIKMISIPAQSVSKDIVIIWGFK